MTTFTLSSPDAYFTHFPKWDESMHFRRTYRTNILKSITGKEQRNTLRTIPVKSLSFTVQPPSIAETSYMRRYLMKYLHQLWGVPVWPREMSLSSAAASGQAVLNIDETRWRGLSNNDPVIVINDYNTYDAGTISSFTNTQITLSGNLTNSYSSGKKVYPLMNVELASPKDLSRLVPGYNKVAMEFIEPFRSETS